MTDQIEKLLSMVVASQAWEMASVIANSEAKAKGEESQGPTQAQYEEAIRRIRALAATVRTVLATPLA